MLFKDVVEMSDFPECQGVSNFRHRPGTLFQQDFCFLQNAFGNDL